MVAEDCFLAATASSEIECLMILEPNLMILTSLSDHQGHNTPLRIKTKVQMNLDIDQYKSLQFTAHIQEVLNQESI